VGVASSSKNCKAVLEKAGIIDLMETRVDGVVSAEIGLKGKPEPDIFTTAADNLGVPYDKAVVIEDAVSGVQAGKAGNFGLVLGVARENNSQELKTNGADIVVEDISEIGFNGICQWFEIGLEEDNWSISYSDYVPEKEKPRETLLAVGNGYFGSRGAIEETDAVEFNYPGTYIAGLYNRLVSRVGDRDVENEDFVNVPDWLPIQFKIGDADWIDINQVKILNINRRLDFRTGLMMKTLIIKDQSGKEIRIESERFASMDNPHIAGISYKITPLNFNDVITIRSSLNGAIINNGVARYRLLNQQHLNQVDQGGDKNSSYLVVKTTQSEIEIALASKLTVYETKSLISPVVDIETNPGLVSNVFKINAHINQEIKVEKLISIYTSQKWDSNNPKLDAVNTLNKEGFSEIKSSSAKSWNEIWKKIDIKIEGDRLAQKLLRLHLYHLMVSLSPNNVKYDASITARGLHGEAYRGHIFWDELFILPLYNIYFPKIAKSALIYRYKRLNAARRYAKEHGYHGAMFPWQSGSDGREETQVVHLNPVTGKWGPDFSSFQRHVSLAITYNIWQYFHITEDWEFMENYGAEMFLEICRFWASKAEFDVNSGKYSIKNVMGPDEFHEKYPGSKEGGLKDNTYTNIMVIWTLNKAFDLIARMDEKLFSAMKSKIKVTEDELEKWKDIISKMNIIIENDILAQYDGYFDLMELDWDYYRKKYDNIYRMDRLLKAEGKSADGYKVSKQADTLQTFYNLDETEVTSILLDLGYKLSDDYLAKNLEYYLQRTSHGSTLSRVVHGQLANMINNKDLSWTLYKDALTSDYADIQGGTTGEGIHAGVMAGTVLIAFQSFAGLNLKSDIVKFEPHLPQYWRSIQFRFMFKKAEYSCIVSKDYIEIIQQNGEDRDVEIAIQGNFHTIKSSEKYKFKIKN
jgi:trehalose/maltose hydrolase-like predicted phosphorylase